MLFQKIIVRLPLTIFPSILFWFHKINYFNFRDGALVKCEIYGEVQVDSHLPGLPDLTLSFSNPSILNDMRFHPCVRFRPWESDQILSFVPPDGEFKLMTYRFYFLFSGDCLFMHFSFYVTFSLGFLLISVLVVYVTEQG